MFILIRSAPILVMQCCMLLFILSLLSARLNILSAMKQKSIQICQVTYCWKECLTLTVAQLYKADGKAIVISPEGFLKGVYFIKMPEKEITNARTNIVLGVYRNGEKLETVKVKFIGPVSKASDAKRN